MIYCWRAWWKKLFATLRKYQWIMSKIESALLCLVADGTLESILTSHVDDLSCAGEGKEYEDSLLAMQTEIHFKINKQFFGFCGEKVKQNGNFEIEMGQFDAIEATDYQVLSKD
jgi:hypothetical protein